jgi:bleomycin hydrolase
MAKKNELTSVSYELSQSWQTDFESDPKNRLAVDAVTKHSVKEVALNRKEVTATSHTYSILLPSNTPTEQNNSGRCWIFAATNMLRYDAMRIMNLATFEFSQPYLMFWDKIEKSNYFLESILNTLDEPVNGRLISHLLQNPVQDGGQWDMLVNLVRKYGLVPKSVMPESESSSNSRVMNQNLTAKLREFAAELRRLHAAGKNQEELRQKKMEMMAVIYRMTCIHLGEPPRKFYWQWTDKDGKFHRAGEITPQAFFKEYVQFDLDSMVCLIHCPTKDKPFKKMYTVQYLGNVVEGEIIRYLNVEMPVIQKAAIDSLRTGQSVWFGSDVGKMYEGNLGLLNMDVFDYEIVYGTKFNSDKAERLDYGQSQMTHAMLLTAVNLDEKDQPTRWRVENSYGDKVADKGFLAMTNAWFDEYVYEVLVDKRFIPAELLPLLVQKPVVLPPWDPMGALASEA